MNSVAWRLVLGIAVVLPITAATTETAMPDGEGKQLTMRVCGNCHALKIVTALRMTKSQWSREVDKMAQAGASATDEEFDVIIDYLAKNFGRKLNVNSASAAQLAEILGLSNSEAAAVIRYREENGNYKNIEELKKVPGLDAKKIEANQDRLTF
jgi:competence protein ComEA